MKYWCKRCKESFPPMRYCLRCGTPLVAGGLASEAAGAASTGERPRRKLASAARLVDDARVPPMVTWGWPEVVAPMFATATIKGVAGCGKSTFSTATAMRVARDTGVPVLYVSAEEGGEPSALVRLARVSAMMGIRVPDNLILSDAQSVREADGDLADYERLLRGRRGFVVVDSLSQLRPPQPWWERLLYSGHGCLFVLHCVTTGEARGGREPEYAVSMTLEVDGEGTCVITKNRWGPTGEDHAFCVRQPPRYVERPRSEDVETGEVIQLPRRRA